MSAQQAPCEWQLQQMTTKWRSACRRADAAEERVKTARSHVLKAIHDLHDRGDDASDWLRVAAVLGQDMDRLHDQLQERTALNPGGGGGGKLGGGSPNRGNDPA